MPRRAALILTTVVAGSLVLPMIGANADSLGAQRPNVVQGAFAGGGPDASTTSEVALPDSALVLQAVPIGRRAAEPTVAVDSEGVAFIPAGNFEGARPAGARTELMRSSDGGLTWQSIQPALPAPIDGEPPVNLDPYVWHDPATDRVISADLTGCGYLLITDDQGESFQRSLAACNGDSVDHQTLFGGPPPAGQTLPRAGVDSAYPSNLYYCTNRVVDSRCSRSFDGGITWVVGGLPPYTGYDPDTGGVCGGLHGHGIVDPEGRVFLPKGHCTEPYVAISEDAGDTWTRVRVSDKRAGADFDLPLFEYPYTFTHTSVASDAAGNIYYVWLDENHLPWLVYSTDHGVTWSEDILIAPPGVTEANFPTVTAGDEGRIAIVFPTHTPREDEADRDPLTRPWNYHVLVSTDVLDGSPTFTYTLANDPADPVYRGDCFGRCGGMYDFLDVIVAPQGEVWATMVDSCMDTTCVDDPDGFDDSYACDPTDPLDPCFASDREPRAAIGNPGMGVAIRQLAGPSLVAAKPVGGGEGGDGGQPAPDPTEAPPAAPTGSGVPMPATGAGVGAVALVALAAGGALRRRR